MKNCTTNTMENENVKIGLVIMASGLGKRFGRNKLMELLDGKPLIWWIINVTDEVFDERIVVTRSKEVKSLCDGLNVDCIYHELPGRNDTVRLGLSAIMEEVDYCFFAPGDQPLIKRETVLSLIDAAKTCDNRIIRTCHGDVIGAPTGFPRALFTELLNLPDKKGGNHVVNNHLSIVGKVFAQDEYELWDVDTVSDLETLNCICENRR